MKEQSHQAEAQAIMQALQACNGQVTRGAALLGISRTTLWRKMAKYGLPLPWKFIVMNYISRIQ